MPKVQIPDDGLEKKQYAVAAITDNGFTYSQHDDRPAAERTVEAIRPVLKTAFENGSANFVHIVLCEIIRIESMDRVMVEDILEDAPLEL